MKNNKWSILQVVLTCLATVVGLASAATANANMKEELKEELKEEFGLTSEEE